MLDLNYPTKMKKIFEEKLKELNEKRKEVGKRILYKKDLAREIFSKKNSSDKSKEQLLSSILSGNRRPFQANELRTIRKIFSCTIDELYPISEDLHIELKSLK